MLISVPFLCLTAAAYLMTQELRNNHGKSLAIHCICLATAYLALACTQLAGPQSNSVGCFAAGEFTLLPNLTVNDGHKGQIVALKRLCIVKVFAYEVSMVLF